MRKRILPIMVGLCLMLIMIPTAAFANSDSYVEIAGTKFEYSEDAVYAVTDDNGAVSDDNASADNYNIKYEDGILYLKDANIIATNSFGIITSGDTTIVLDGDNNVEGSVKSAEDRSRAESYGIISRSGILTIKDGEASGTGSLTVSGAAFEKERDISACISAGIYIAGSNNDDSCGLKVESGVVRADGKDAVRFADAENTYSYGVFSAGGISVTGGDLIAYSDTAYTSTAIFAEENIDINGGTVSATSLSEKFSFEDNKSTVYSGGIYSSKGNITISGDDTVVDASGNQALSGSVGISAEKGAVTVNGGTVSTNFSDETFGFVSDDDAISCGILASGDILINNGQVNASGYDAFESYGIHSSNGDITINADVYAIGGRSKDAGGSAGIATGNGDVIINKGMVYVTTSINEGATGTGIYAKGNIFVKGGNIMATTDTGFSDGCKPGSSSGIFSDGGDITVSGDDTFVYALGGNASEKCTGMETFGGDVIIQSGTVYATDFIYTTGFNSNYGSNYGINTAEDNGKGGNIIIANGTVHVLGKSASLNYTGDLTASPQQGTKIIIKTLESVGEEYMPEYGPGYTQKEFVMMFEKLFEKADEIDGSPFVKETVVNEGSISNMQYFVGYAEINNSSDESASSADDSIKNDSAPETGDSNGPLIWIACILVSAVAAVFITVSGMRRIKQ